MTNEELQKLDSAYVKSLTADIRELKIWLSEDYVNNRRKGESVTLLCQHEHNPDIWIVEHKDGTEGGYLFSEFARKV